MLTHLVCWKYKPEITAEQRAQHIALLENLPHEIAEILSFSVGADVLKTERSFDTGLVATYADRAALAIYDAHPAHRQVVAFGASVAERVVTVDFETE